MHTLRNQFRHGLNHVENKRIIRPSFEGLFLVKVLNGRCQPKTNARESVMMFHDLGAGGFELAKFFQSCGACIYRGEACPAVGLMASSPDELAVLVVEAAPRDSVGTHRALL